MFITLQPGSDYRRSLFLMVTMFPSLTRLETWAEDIKRDLQNQF